MVFSSTAAVYGNANYECGLNENARTQAQNPYRHSKLFIEQILHDTARAHSEFGFIAFRYFNIAGRSRYLPLVAPKKAPTHLIFRALEVATG